MLIPPHPSFDKTTFAALSKLSWTTFFSDVGRLNGGHLVMAGGPTPRWTVVEGSNIPSEIAPRFITREAYDALVGGELQDDGTLLWKEKRWVLTDNWDGIRLIAKLAPVDAQATGTLPQGAAPGGGG
jgi:hypothetical protein